MAQQRPMRPVRPLAQMIKLLDIWPLVTVTMVWVAICLKELGIKLNFKMYLLQFYVWVYPKENYRGHTGSVVCYLSGPYWVNPIIIQEPYAY